MHPSQPAATAEPVATDGLRHDKQAQPSVAVVLPAYNEEAIIEQSLTVMHQYMHANLTAYRWEIVVVNDGSRDRTPEIADRFADTHDHVRVVHHPTNFGMGQALITGFRHNRAEYVITMDLDLSYGPEHIPALLARIRQTRAHRGGVTIPQRRPTRQRPVASENAERMGQPAARWPGWKQHFLTDRHHASVRWALRAGA